LCGLIFVACQTPYNKDILGHGSSRTLNQASNFSLLEKLPSPEQPGNTSQKNFFAVSCMCHKTNVGGRRHMPVLKHGNLIHQETEGRIESMDMAEDCKAQGARTF
jgi:hypothetical protein